MSIDFERTRNMGLVSFILTDPGVWPLIGDDFAGRPEDFRPNEDPRIWYVAVFEEFSPAGLFLFLPESPVCWQAHVAMLPQAWGRIAHAAGRAIVPWVWAHTKCQRIEARVPRSNPAAVLFGLRAMGLRKFGVSERSFQKDGRLWDQVVMGISRPEGA